MISKELLSEVLDIDITDDGYFVISDDNRFISIFQDNSDFEPDFKFNIYELAHKCKEWAKSKGYYILSGYDESSIPEAIINHTYSGAGCYCEESLEAETEPEAIFKACQWVLNYKDN